MKRSILVSAPKRSKKTTRFNAIGIVLSLVMSFGSVPGAAGAADLFTHSPSIHLDGSASVSLILFGEILSGDSQRLEATVNRLNENGIVVNSVHLYSPGGLVVEGLAIGRFLRDRFIYSVAPWAVEEGLFCPSDRQLSGAFDVDYEGYFTNQDEQNCVCASACALAWLGGLSRSGVVGFHHSFVQSTERRLSFSDYASQLENATFHIQEYLQEMRGPRYIEDAIFSTASNEMSFFDTFQLPDLGRDPLYYEYVLRLCPRSPGNSLVHLRCEGSVAATERRRVQLGEE